MKIQKTISYLIILFPLLTFSQVQISGKVLDQNEDPVVFANIILSNPLNGDLVKGILSTEHGTFRLSAPEGHYNIAISFIGYKTWSKTINLIEDRELGKITLVEDETVLQEVIVEGKKPLIEQRIDRLIFNVENSAASQGMSGLDAIRNTPMIRAQGDDISIIGKSSVSVMINGRILNLTKSELNNYLQSLRSDDISKIEVITTPPSKYEAQGNSGIINIVLKKNSKNGWNGTINTTYQRNTKDGERIGAKLNYHSNKLSSSLNIRQYSIGYTPKGTRSLESNTYKILTAEEREDRTTGGGLNFNLDYGLNNKSDIGIIYDFGRSTYNIDSQNRSIYGVERDSVLVTNAIQKTETPTHTLSAYYDLKLDTLGKKLSVTGNFLSNVPDKVNNFSTLNRDDNHESIVKNNSKMDYKVYSGKTDLSLPYQWSKIEIGAKYTYLENNSDVRYYNYINSNYIIDRDNSNIFDYKEQNYAAYFSLEKDFGEKWTAKAGLRYEYTILRDKTTPKSSENIKDNYGKLFPTVYFSYKPNDNHVFSINYSKRINRPSFQSLNPFRWYTNPYIYYAGNPLLQPSFNDNVELSYSYKKKLTFSLYNQYSKNAYSNIARFENGIYSNIIENSYNQNNTGVRLGYYNTFVSRWEASLSANSSYSHTQPIINELKELNIFSFYYSIYNTIALNEGKTYYALINFWHSLPFNYGNTYIEDQMEFSIGIKTSFFNNTLQASVIANDLFKTIKNDGYTVYNGYKENFTQYNDYRRITFGLTYLFGNKKVKVTDKNIEFEEKSRAN